MAYFKKLIFDPANGKLTFYKVQVEGTQITDDGTEVVDLKFESDSTDMKLLRITKENTTAGVVYVYSVSASSEKDGTYLLETGFGYIDSDNPTAQNLFPMSFGRFLDQGTIDMNETVSPCGTPLCGISRQEGKFGCIIGEDDVDYLPPMPPMVAVMESIDFYLGLEAGNIDGSKTYYSIKLQRADTPT